MKKSGILNAGLLGELAKLRHTDKLVICDAGFPIPAGANTVDVSLVAGIPDFPQVLRAVLDEMIFESYVVFDNMREKNPEYYENLVKTFEKQESREVPFKEFVELSKEAKLFIRTGENEFIAAGVGAWVSFRTGGDRKCCLASCEELYGGEVVQVLNGDETAHDNLLFLRGRLYQQDAVAPDGETIPAALYGLSSQRRFRKDAQARFKVSGIYRIKLLP